MSVLTISSRISSMMEELFVFMPFLLTKNDNRFQHTTLFTRPTFGGSIPTGSTCVGVPVICDMMATDVGLYAQV